MKEKKTLFNYLYDELVKQIKSGKLAYGESIPSCRSLCGAYNVGIRTVRDVIKKLSAEGYIKTVARSHIEVAYKADCIAANMNQIDDLLAKRNATIDLMEAMGYLMPYVYAEAAKLIDEPLIAACRNDIKGIEQLPTKERWRVSSVALQRIIAVFGNSLLRDLYIDADLFGQVPIVDGFENPYAKVPIGTDNGLHGFFDMLLYRDTAGIRRVIGSMYHHTACELSLYFDELSRAFPQAQFTQSSFVWNAQKGRLHRYTAIARSLIEKIAAGVYPDGGYLPLSLKLQAEYNVSALTIRKALDTLAFTGLVHKISQRGRYLVTLGEAKTKELVIEDGAPTRDALTMLSSIHITALVCKGIAFAGFDYLSPEAADKLEAEINNPGIMAASTPNHILEELVQAQPLHSLKNVYGQLGALMNWGCFFDFARDDAVHKKTIDSKSRIAIGYIRTKNKDAFADMLQDIYRFIFEVMQKGLLGFGISESASILLP